MENNDKKEPSTVVEVLDGGPLRIKGHIVLKDLKRDITKACEEVMLCTCGESANKPFCDRSHAR
ncbi:MAG: CDGSH iron-sulfur domain-containing protein [Bacteroidota bacterium]|nr:CDGSH iron-sulfur domain-containing protein [Bacteroidota bacterium]